MPASQPLILNVDDDPAGRHARNETLSRSGFMVRDAEDGRAALGLAAAHRPALVLLAGTLPDMSSLEVCRRLKRDWPDVVIVRISTVTVSSLDKVAGLESGVDCYLTAPLEPAELIAVTRAMLRIYRAEVEARESNERFRMIVESAIDYAIFTCGLDGRITSWNTGAEAILGYPSEEIIGQPCARIFMADDIAADVPDEEMRQARSGLSVRAERWHRRRDGTKFWSSGRMVPLRDHDGTVTGFLKILYDRTVEWEARNALLALNEALETRVAERTRALEESYRKLREEAAEREHSEEQLRQLQKIEALGQLTGGIAHDFNNLLTAIMGGLEVARRRIEDPRTLRLVDSASSAAERGARLVAQLLAFARKQNLEVAPVVLNDLVREMRELLERSIGSRISVSFDLAPNLWPAAMDAAQMQTALLNLAINARDAMPDGGSLAFITRNLHVGPGGGRGPLTPGDHVELAVRDTGTGMSEDIRGRVFEPFFTTKEVGKGTGLGLAQVYGFVRQSGGDVKLESAPDQGTTVRIILPRAPEG